MEMSWLNRFRSSTLLKSSGTYIGFTALNVLISLFSMSALTRLLGPEQYGVIGALTALTVLASALVGLNTSGLVSVQYFRAEREAFRASVGASVGVMAGTAAATAILFAVASDKIAAVSGVTPFWQWTVVLAATGRFALALAQTVWQVQGLAFRYGCWQVTSSILFLTITLALITRAGLGWEGYAIGQAVAPAMLGITGLLVIAGSGMLTLRFKRDHLVQALRFGLPLLPHTLAGVAIASMDRLILSGSVGAGETGIYFVAVQVSSILVLVGGAVNQAWVPWLFGQLSNGSATARARVVTATYALFAAFAVAAAILVISGPLIVKILAAEHYSDAARLLPLLCPAAALNAAYYLVVNYIIYARRTALLSALTVAAAVVQAILTISLAILDGTVGVATATLVSAALYFCLTWYAAARLVPMPWFRRT